jgi:hypothetical protein
MAERRTSTWVFAAMLLAMLFLVTAVLGGPQWLLMPTALAIIMWAPGYCLAVLASISDLLLSTVLSVAVSITLSVLVATALFYLGVWTALATVAIAADVTVAAGAIALRNGGST